MASWLSGREFEQPLGDSEGQESLVCYSSWGHRRVKNNLVTEQEQGKQQWHLSKK